MGLAGWMNVQGEKEDDRMMERTRKEGDRLVHEKVLQDRRRERALDRRRQPLHRRREGRGVAIDDLKGAVASLDLGELESMKEAGAKIARARGGPRREGEGRRAQDSSSTKARSQRLVSGLPGRGTKPAFS